MKTKVIFTLPAEAVEGASEVVLLGDFNNWNPEQAPRLKKQKDGSFKIITQLEAGLTYQYRFLLDDGRWVNDYHAQSYASVPGYYIDNCIITVPEPAEENIVKRKTAKPDTKKKTAVKASKKTSAKETTPKTAKAKSADEKEQVKKTKKASVKNSTEKENE